MTNKFKRLLITTLIIVCFALAGAAYMGTQAVQAATTNPTTASPGYELWHFYVPGALTATATPIKFKVPWPYRVVSLSANARVIDRGDGNETYTVDLKQESTSLLSTALSMATAALNYDAVLSTSSTAIPDEATVSLVFTLGGTTPSITDITTVIGVKRQ